jgi:broad specificity phosphatase PhoE
MHRSSRILSFLLPISLLVTSAFAPVPAGEGRPHDSAQVRADSTTTIVLVRHAEKAAEPAADPPLTPAGMARAKALTDALRGSAVTAVYSTPYVRTRSTAQPVAALAGVQVIELNPSVPPTDKAYGEQYAREILAKHRGGVVLVVGHSNTVPAILRGLGVGAGVTIADDEHDRLFIVTVPKEGAARLIEARYGAPR